MHHIIKSEKLWEVLQAIQSIDENIFYNKRLLKAHLHDLYIGRKVYIDAFLAIVSCMPEENGIIIKTSKEKFKQLKFPENNIDEEIHKQLLIYCYNIYVRCDYSFSSFGETSNHVTSRKFASHIDGFTCNLNDVFWGDEILLSWKVNNPYLLKLSDGEVMVNVTSLSSTTVLATNDKYTLFLYDQSNKLIDKRQINIKISSLGFCIFCGHRFISLSDKYCCYCGTKKYEL